MAVAGLPWELADETLSIGRHPVLEAIDPVVRLQDDILNREILVPFEATPFGDVLRGDLDRLMDIEVLLLAALC